MTPQAAYRDQEFILKNVLGFQNLLASRSLDVLPDDTLDAVLREAANLADEQISPLRRVSDQQPARLSEGQVFSSPGFAQAYEHITKGGWIGVCAAPEFGGLGLPNTIGACVNEMLAGACMALHLKVMLSQGQIDALEQHAAPELKALYLPKLISGEWSGTMNLTEPQAGSDLAALRAQAVPNADGSYAVSGQKIFITWGDSDLVTNLCHLVLARLPDAPAGSKGISLFLVPKFIPDADGKLGPRNRVEVLSLEEKLGLHGSPTCVMEFDAAQGWLVGQPHQGLSAMFAMMNNARLAVAMQGVGVGEAALQQAVAYAAQREQGRTGTAAAQIIGHADVRRMLAVGRAQIFAARAIALSCAAAFDQARLTDDPQAEALAGILTPIAKAYCTEVGQNVADMALQVHGGMGYIEETGVAQYQRDLRVASIYEGTNGIQSMDLVGRKLADGTAIFTLLNSLEAELRTARTVLPDLAEQVWEGLEALREASEYMLGAASVDRQAGGDGYLRGFALVLGSCLHLKAAVADPERLGLARVMVGYVLPGYLAAFAQAKAGASPLFEVSISQLSPSV